MYAYFNAANVLTINGLARIFKPKGVCIRHTFGVCSDILHHLHVMEVVGMSTNGSRFLAASLLSILLALPPAVSAQIPTTLFTRIWASPVACDSTCSWSAAWIDYNDDGWLDLYVVNGFYFAGIDNFLYRNDGEGVFTRITTGPIVNDGMSGAGCTWGDYDNDGDTDLYVANSHFHRNQLFRNKGDGQFQEITNEPPAIDAGASMSPAWIDYDNDGDLDLFVTNGAGDCINYLYRNDGVSFTSISPGPIVTYASSSHCVGWSDYDLDGDLDCYVANFQHTNDLFRNDGGGTFTMITEGEIVTDLAISRGCSWGDIDNDGDMDLFVANQQYPSCLYLNNGDGSFFKVTSGDIVTNNDWSFGSCFGDFDNDGDLDLVVTNCRFGAPGPSTNFFYKNNGDGTFVPVLDEPLVTDDGLWDAVVCGDYDNDGDLDLFVTNEATVRPNALYRNNLRTKLPGQTDAGMNYISIVCIGTTSNRSAVGAKVRIRTTIGGQPLWQMREISSKTGYFAQNSMRAHFGLGDAAVIDTVFVEWPSGIVDGLYGVAANQRMSITEGDHNVAALLIFFSAAVRPGGVSLAWRTSEDLAASELSLRCRGGANAWDVPVVRVGFGSYEAFDDSPARGAECELVYGLYECDTSPAAWRLLHEERVLWMPAAASTRIIGVNPNPFNQSTQIIFSLARPERLRIMIFDAAGRRVALLSDRKWDGGLHTIDWDGRDEAGRNVSSGVYSVILSGRRTRDTRKLVLVR